MKRIAREYITTITIEVILSRRTNKRSIIINKMILKVVNQIQESPNTKREDHTVGTSQE